jgi:hypothetical protein
MENFKIYHNDIPILHENVLVIFLERNDTHIEGVLVEYVNYKAIMSYNDASKKKKIYNWNDVVPLNKPMVARIDDIYEDNCVQLSIAYFEVGKTDEDKIKLTKQLLEPFNKNKVLLSRIKKLCYNQKLDFVEFWYNIIHPLDKLRKDDESEYSLFEYYEINFDKLLKLITDKYDENVYLELQKLNNIEVYKINSKIGLISNQGIKIIFDVIKNVIDANDWTFNFKYISAPYYTLESLSNESTIINHENFINMLNEESIKNNIKVEIVFIGNKNN